MTNTHETKDFILLITGSESNDSAAERAMEEGLELVRCKLCYCPPYEKFGELKKLQLRLRSSSYLKGRRVCCALDISEWVGHESEEFFIVTLKFLHDHCSRVHYIFTVGAHTENEAKAVYFRLRCYMRGYIATDLTFLSTGTLCGYIESKNIDRKAARILAQMIMTDEMSGLRSYPVVDMMCVELRELSGAGRYGTVGLISAADYLSDPDALPAILCGSVSERFARQCRSALPAADIA